MKTEVQLSLDSFNTASPLRCRAVPGQNAFKNNCLPCVHAKNQGHRIFCTRFSRPVPNGQKYSLKEWKSRRVMFLERDGHRCVICEGKNVSPIHHIDLDPTNDDPLNLVTLCNFCHARAHAELQRAGGAKWVQKVIEYYRMQRNVAGIGERG